MDKLSDIYASGITFYRLLNNTNKLPFPFNTNDEWLKAVKKEQFPPREILQHIPDKVAKILKKSIHKTKTTRFQTCTEFRQALEKLNFHIDWVWLDDDNWMGQNNGDTYTLNKYKRRTSWTIEFKRNGKRNSKYCSSNLADDEIENTLFQIIKDTNLCS